MEDYIYILIGVIWLAATIYKASQKKKQGADRQNPAHPAATSEKPLSPRQSLLDQLLSGQQVRIPDPEVREIEVEYEDPIVLEAAPKPPLKSFQSEYASYGFKGLEALSVEGSSSTGHISFVDIMKEPDKNRGGRVEFDLRKAIIYKAILERPYT